MTRQERIGLLFAGLCALNGALVPAMAKLTTERATPLLVAAATTLFAGSCAVGVLAVRGEVGRLLEPGRRVRLMIVGALGTAAAFFLFYAGTQRSTAIEAVLCLQIEPAYSLIAAWCFLGHRPTRRRVFAVAIILLGIILAVGAHGFVASGGVWLLLATPLCWQVSHLVVLRGLVGVRPSVLAGARYSYGGLLLLFCWIVSGGVTTLPPFAELLRLLPLLAFQGLVLSYVGTLFWYQAIMRIDLARVTAIVVPSIPLLSLGATFLLLGDVPTPPQWLGLMLTASGVLSFVSAPHASTAKAPAAWTVRD